ncbi:DUF3526 domain-containing protein [Chryseobacterium arthrosphaerae]|uniref:DUF3526 domain-containing protein n=1 Tax=Chryseobacterium arthrosphaerae TaxID=651561 RepID=A0A3S0N520_9FLAO|nr:DUF3526 domain-containing protein [Chryseobacterium arthrosphaerae]
MILLPGPGTMPCSIWVIWNLQSLQKSIPKNAEKKSGRNLSGYLLPNLHTQLTTSHLAKTDMSNHLQYASSLRKFHEKKRLFFYPLIFSGKNAESVNWAQETIEVSSFAASIGIIRIFLPYLISSLIHHSFTK